MIGYPKRQPCSNNGCHSLEFCVHWYVEYHWIPLLQPERSRKSLDWEPTGLPNRADLYMHCTATALRLMFAGWVWIEHNTVEVMPNSSIVAIRIHLIFTAAEFLPLDFCCWTCTTQHTCMLHVSINQNHLALHGAVIASHKKSLMALHCTAPNSCKCGWPKIVTCVFHSWETGQVMATGAAIGGPGSVSDGELVQGYFWLEGQGKTL